MTILQVDEFLVARQEVAWLEIGAGRPGGRRLHLVEIEQIGILVEVGDQIALGRALRLRDERRRADQLDEVRLDALEKFVLDQIPVTGEEDIGLLVALGLKDETIIEALALLLVALPVLDDPDFLPGFNAANVL